MPDTPLTWRNQQTVNTTTAGFQGDSDITQLANGNILVSWTTGSTDAPADGTPNSILAQLYDPLGNRIGGEFRLNNASTGDNEQNSDLAALPGGGFIVVYHDVDDPFNGGASNIRLEEYDAAGNQVSENALVISDSGSPGDPDYSNPRVAASSDTSVFIVYEETSAGVSNIRGKIYNPATDTYSAQISLIASPGGNTDPDVVALTNGNYVVACRNDTGADSSISYRIVNSAGANVLAVTRVPGTDTDTDTDSEPTVTALTGGGFVIAWTNTDTNDTDIQFAVFNAAGTQTGSGTVGSAGATDNHNEPAVTALADGTFVIVWDDDTNELAEVQHVSATGALLGSVFSFSGANTEFSVTGLDDGRFAVSWTDLAGTGEIQMEILDTRDVPNDPGVYTPDQWVVGTVGNDIFTPAGNAEITHGWTGNDNITESGGTRQYFGDEGDDRINVVSAINADLHDGGTGTDRIDWSASAEVGASFDLTAGTATTADGLSTEVMVNFENFIGTENADIIRGTAGANDLRGGGGDDRFRVDGGGADFFNGGTGNDVVDYRNSLIGVQIDLALVTTGGGAAGDTYSSIQEFFGSNTVGDTLIGNGVANRFNGFGGNDTLDGAGGNDNLSAGTGIDELTGGLGVDTMRGGADADDFNYSSTAESGLGGGARDRISDFEIGIDDIDVSAIDARTGTGGNQAFSYIAQAAFTAEGQIRAFQQGLNTIVEFNTTGSDGAEMSIQLINFTATTLAGTDFIL